MKYYVADCGKSNVTHNICMRNILLKILIRYFYGFFIIVLPRGLFFVS